MNKLTLESRGRIAGFVAAAALVGCGMSSENGATEPALIPAGHADPCVTPPNSGYANDELCMEPPAPDVGLQLHFGPNTYDDPQALNPFILDPGKEDVVCEYMTTPNTEDRHFIEYHAHLRTGTHHMITYVTDTGTSTQPDGAVLPCNFDPTYRFMLGSQAALGKEGGILDVPLPGKNATAPENEGLATKLPASTKGLIEMHYVNATDTPMLREGWINIIYTPDDQVKGIVDPIFFIGGLGMNVPPQTTQIVKAEGCGLSDGQGAEIRVLGLTAHSHAATRRMSAYVDRANGNRELIYESYDWSEPLNAEMDSVHTNPAPGNGTVDGAVSGLLKIQRGDTVSWECEVHNTLDTSLRFDNYAYTAEMCNLFGFVTPGLGVPWSCFKF